MKLVFSDGMPCNRPSGVSLTVHSTYKKSKLSDFHVDWDHCRSTKEWFEIIVLNERISEITL
jgi:hypothetical protein